MAPAVAGGLEAHQPRALAVVHIAHQHPVLDQDGARAGRAFVVHGQGAAPALDGAVVEDGDARRRHPLADPTGEGRGPLAVEVAFQAVAHRLVQEDAVPAGAQHHVHLAGGAGDGLQIDQGLAQRLLHLILPAVRRDPGLEAGAAAGAGRAVLPPAVLVDGDRDIDPRQGPHVADQPAVGAQNLHHPPLAGERGHHLGHARVAGAGEGVDLLQQGHLFGEARRGQRVLVAIEFGVGGPGPLGGDTGIAPLGQGRRFRRPLDGGQGNLAGVGVAGRLAGHHPQAETLGRIIGGRFEPAVVPDEELALGPLHEDLAVVRPLQRPGQHLGGGGGVDAGGFKDRRGDHGSVHLGFRCSNRRQNRAGRSDISAPWAWRNPRLSHCGIRLGIPA